MDEPLKTAEAPAPPTDAMRASSRSLVSLLGEQRSEIVERLHHAGDTTVAELASHLGISEVATRRHLAVLEGEGLVATRTAPRGRHGRGRPAARYELTDAAARLFPHGYDRFAAEVLDFLADRHGRDGLRAFLRWRLQREVGGLREAVTAEDLHDRLEQLAAALSAAGFRASVSSDGDGFTLTQDHCAIFDVAREHPEVCAYEAATFSQVLGSDVQLSRRETLATGHRACVCCVTPRDATGARGTARTAEAATETTATTDTTQTTGPSTSHGPGRGDEL